MRSLAFVPTGICAFALALLTAGCGDDTSTPSDAGTDLIDAGDVSDATVEECDGVVVADSPGAACGGFTPCGEGLQCSRLDASEEEGVCRQVCVPEQCESVCQGEEVCVPLNESPGTGVCAEPPTGTRAAYETCSEDAGFCDGTLTCLVGSAAATEGVCLPECVDDACVPIDGREAQCVIRVGEGADQRSYCAPACSAVGADDECPGDMACFASGPGFVCAFGQ